MFNSSRNGQLLLSFFNVLCIFYYYQHANISAIFWINSTCSFYDLLYVLLLQNLQQPLYNYEDLLLQQQRLPPLVCVRLKLAKRIREI